MLKSKIHRATITDTDLNYEGSIGIDAALMRAADLLPYEQVHVLDVTNGARFQTYVIEEPEHSGRIGVYGAAAHLVTRGDTVIVLAYNVQTESEARTAHPHIVYVDGANKPAPQPQMLKAAR
jgi:aspartate 1-decarboxylase